MSRSTRGRKRVSIARALEELFNHDMGFPIELPTQQRRTRAARKSTPRAPKKANTPNTSVIVLDDSDEECASTVVSRSKKINENASRKVDDFFKSSGLISDDEDDALLFQSIRSSQNEHTNTDINDPCSSLAGISSSKSNNKVIVLDDETNEISTVEDIQNYCKETEDLLKNANAILDNFTGADTLEEQTVKQAPPEESPTDKVNPTRERGLGECPICYENFSEKQIMTTKCGHLFCKICMEKIATTVKKCPTCRKPVNKKNIIPIYI